MDSDNPKSAAMMKALKLPAVLFIAAMVVWTVCAAAKGGPTEKEITIVDEIHFNGTELEFRYRVTSRCEKEYHDSFVELQSKKRDKSVHTLKIRIFDAAYEDKCEGEEREVTVNGGLNIADFIDEERESLEEKGFKLSDKLKMELPAVRPPEKGSGSVPGEEKSEKSFKKRSGAASGVKKMEPPKEQVTMHYVTYTIQWKCVLRKKDGARNDGFYGYGATMDAAINESVRGCKVTNHPKCQQFGYDNNHTECASETRSYQDIKVVNVDAAPAGAEMF